MKMATKTVKKTKVASNKPKSEVAKGRPPLNPKERAESLGLKSSDYAKRTNIGLEMKRRANILVTQLTTGVPGDKTNHFRKAWDQARKEAVSTYGEDTFNKLKIPIKITDEDRAKRKKKKPKSKKKKKGAAK